MDFIPLEAETPGRLAKDTISVVHLIGKVLGQRVSPSDPSTSTKHLNYLYGDVLFSFHSFCFHIKSMYCVFLCVLNASAGPDITALAKVVTSAPRKVRLQTACSLAEDSLRPHTTTEWQGEGQWSRVYSHFAHVLCTDFY